ncbi:MAG: hypothetical protein NTZ05_20130 [Chloroflexi bacterium]|nr:hypothetical protein [Chloroflexota bacterium]
MQVRIAAVIGRDAVPDLTEPTSVAVDLQGNLVVCDRPSGTPTLSRLMAAEGYRREVIGRGPEIGLEPLLVRLDGRGAPYVCGELPEGDGKMAVRRLSPAGTREQPYPLAGPPSDIAVDHEGKLWVIFREGSMNPTVQAYDGFGRMTYDYDTAVEEAQNEERIAPPLFMDGQYLAVSPGGKVWFGGFLERASCVRLSADGDWEFWDYPTDFQDARGLVDYYGLAALSEATLITTDFRSLDGGPKRQYLVELDLPRRRFIWHDLAALGLADAVEPAEPSVWDLCYVSSARRVYLCDYTYHRIIVLDVSGPTLA